MLSTYLKVWHALIGVAELPPLRTEATEHQQLRWEDNPWSGGRSRYLGKHGPEAAGTRGRAVGLDLSVGGSGPRALHKAHHVAASARGPGRCPPQQIPDCLIGTA